MPFKELLGDWGGGKVGPSRFARLWLACFGLFIAAPFASMAAVAAFTMMMTGDLPEPSAFAGGFFLLAWVIIGAAMFNITLKRGRDIGWSGTLTGLATILLFLFGGAPFFLTILLAFVPSKSFGRSST